MGKRLDIVNMDDYTATYIDGKLDGYNDSYAFTYAEGVKDAIKEGITEVKEWNVDEYWWFDEAIDNGPPENFSDMKTQ